MILSFRTSALEWPLLCESEDQKLSPNKVYNKQLLQNLCRTPPTTWSHGLGSCTVLPPIGKPLTGKEQELSPGQSVDKAYPIHKSSSDSYLIQMEKQKLRGKVTYKVGVTASLYLVWRDTEYSHFFPQL